MNEFHLQIVTPDGMIFDGKTENVIVRTVQGDVGILANHTEYAVPLGIGPARIKFKDGYRKASCAGGLLSVSKNITRIVAVTFEWADEIDLERAKRAKERAEELIRNKTDDYEIKMARLKLRRALNRINVADK